MNELDPKPRGEQSIEFATTFQTPGRTLVTFQDPYTAYAIHQRARDAESSADPAFVLAIYPPGEAPETFSAWADRVTADGAALPVSLKGRGTEVWWCQAGAVLQCDPAEMEALRAAVVEFSFYERVLGAMEAEVASSWAMLEADRRLACTVTASDLKQGEAFADRMSDALGRRIRFARLQPHLLAPDRSMLPAGQSLGSSLREKTSVEGRAEALDAHLAVFEQIYELASPRMGESRDAHEGQRIEWIIIWLLVAEVALSLLQVLVRR